MKAEEKIKKINEIESAIGSCQTCINTLSGAVNTLAMTLNSFYASLSALKNDFYIEMNKELYKEKLTMSDLFDYDESLKDVPCTAITQACEQTGMVSPCDYLCLESEFMKRGWKVKRRKDFDPQPSPADYYNYKVMVMDVIAELYKIKFHPENTEPEHQEVLMINGYDLFE